MFDDQATSAASEGDLLSKVAAKLKLHGHEVRGISPGSWSALVAAKLKLHGHKVRGISLGSRGRISKHVAGTPERRVATHDVGLD